MTRHRLVHSYNGNVSIDGAVRKSGRSKRQPERYGIQYGIRARTPPPEDVEDSGGDDFDRLADEFDQLRTIDEGNESDYEDFMSDGSLSDSSDQVPSHEDGADEDEDEDEDEDDDEPMRPARRQHSARSAPSPAASSSSSSSSSVTSSSSSASSASSSSSSKSRKKLNVVESAEHQHSLQRIADDVPQLTATRQSHRCWFPQCKAAGRALFYCPGCLETREKWTMCALHFHETHKSMRL